LKTLALGIVILLALTTSVFAYAPNSVSDYAIISLYESSPGVATCSLQATFCGGCNPNMALNPGCPAFTHGFPPQPCSAYYSCGGSIVDGRFAAVQLTKLPGGTPIVDKMVLDTLLWPLDPGGFKYKEAFVFAGLTAGDQVEVWGELFCSWCGHWYACPETLTIAPHPDEVPSHTPWSIIILVLLIAGTGILIMFRRKKATAN